MMQVQEQPTRSKFGKPSGFSGRSTLHSDIVPAFAQLPVPLPLVGRSREVAALERLLELDNDERVAILIGSSGVGKSRLVSGLTSRAAERGWQVAHGRAYPMERGLPYGLFGDAFLPLIEALGRERLRVLSRGAEDEFAHLFPSLGTATSRRASTEGGDFESRLLWNFSSFLQTLGREAPLLIALEDLQWADEASLKLLHFIARKATGSTVRIVCSYNEVERDGNANWVVTERSLLGLHLARALRIGPLDRESTLDLVTRTFDVDPAVVSSFATRLFEWTQGNPYFIEQTLSTLVDRGQLHTRDGIWLGWESDFDDLPHSVRDAVFRRVGDLSPDAARLLDCMTVLGVPATARLLERVLDLSDEERFSALEALVSGGVIREVAAEAGDATYEIRHPIFRRTLYEGMSAARAARLHGAIGVAMEALAGADGTGAAGTDQAHEIGQHLARSDRPEHRAAAIRYLMRAGEGALDRQANRVAIADLTEAVRLADSLPPDQPTPLDPGRRIVVVAKLAEAHQRLGEYREARGLWERALAGTPESEIRARASLLRHLGTATLMDGHRGLGLDRLTEAVRLAEVTGDPHLRARVLLSRGGALQELGRADEALQDIEAGLSLAGDDRNLRARAHNSLGMLHVWTGPPEDARRHLNASLELATADEHPDLRFWSWWGLAVLNAMNGRREELDDAIRQAAAVAESVHSPVMRLWVDELRLEKAYAEGRWETAIAIGEQAIAVARNLKQDLLLPRLLAWTSAIYLGRGDARRAREFVDEACALAGMDREEPADIHAIVPAHIGLAHFHLATQDYHEAIRVAEKGLAIAEGTGYVLWALHRLLPILAESRLWLEDTVGAEEVTNRMREHSRRMNHRAGLALADAGEGMIAWKRGDPEKGARLMRQAADDLEAIPLLPIGTRIRRQMAGRLAEIGERDESVKELRKVHESFRRMGLERELEKARGQFREVGARPPSRARSGAHPELTDRELEIALMVAQGGSNKAVGRELNISARTVSTHLTRIFHKLGVATRGDLAGVLDARE